MDITLLLILVPQDFGRILEVSILVLMDITLLHILHLAKYIIINYVSILVLMDITLLHLKYASHIHREFCFNPCFNGYYTFTII